MIKNCKVTFGFKYICTAVGCIFYARDTGFTDMFKILLNTVKTGSYVHVHIPYKLLLYFSVFNAVIYNVYVIFSSLNHNDK